LLERKLQQWYFKPLGIEYINLKIVHFALICVIFELLDCIHFILFRQNTRFSFIARSLIMATLPAVQNLGGCVLAVLGELTTVVTCFFMTLLLFAWIAVTIFNTQEDFLSVSGVGNCGGPDGTCVLTHSHKPINEGLDTLFSTFYTMFKAGTTDEFTDLFLPSFTMYRVTGLLWMGFLIIVHVLLLNLVLDTLVAAYTDNTEEEEETQVERKVEGMKIAYETLLHTTGDARTITDKHTKKEQVVLSKRSFLDFVEELGRSPHLRDIPESTASIIFDAIQSQEDGEHKEGPHTALSRTPSQAMLKEYVTLDKFCAMCAVIEYDFWTVEKDSPVRDMLGERIWNSWWYTKLRSMVDCQEDENGEKQETSTFDGLMNLVLMCNLVLVVLETAYDLRWIKKDDEARALPQIELIFSFIYIFECGTKLCCWSWAEYTSDRSNTFDFCTTWLLLGSSVLEEIEDAYGGNDSGSGPQGLDSLRGHSVKGLKRYMNILRLLRLLRMVKTLKKWKKVQFMVATMITLVKASVDILILLWVVIFFFTTLSVQLWGGLLYEGNTKLEGSEYAEKEFFVLNYNDFLTAFGAWVVSILCEYQSDFAEAVWLVTDKNVSWLVFPVFYLVGVCIVFELVKAFTIEVFLDLKKHEGESKEDEEFEGIKTVQDMAKKDGKALHFRPVGDQTVLEKLLKELKKLKPGGHGHGHGGHHEEHHARPDEYEGLECSVQ
jgi:two pore calcium channel protein